MSPASTIIKTVSRSCKGRNKYTKEEDVAMITFLVTERRYLEATGKRVWKDMELLEVTSHSAESMSTRYRKVILPNIEKYKHEISPRWISLLTGNIQREKEPEFSVDALFKPRTRRSKSPMAKSHTGNSGNTDDQQRTSQYFTKTSPLIDGNKTSGAPFPLKRGPLSKQFENSFAEEIATAEVGSGNKKVDNQAREMENSVNVNPDGHPVSKGRTNETANSLSEIVTERRLRKRHKPDEQDTETIEDNSLSKRLHLNESQKSSDSTELESFDIPGAQKRDGKKQDKAVANVESLKKNGNEENIQQEISSSIRDQNSDSQSILKCSKRSDLDVNGSTSPKSTMFIKLDVAESKHVKSGTSPNAKVTESDDKKSLGSEKNSKVLIENEGIILIDTQADESSQEVLCGKEDHSNNAKVHVKEKTATKNIDDREDSESDFDSFDKMLVNLAKRGHHKKVNVLSDSDEDNDRDKSEKTSNLGDANDTGKNGNVSTNRPEDASDISELNCTVILQDISKGSNKMQCNDAGKSTRDQIDNVAADSTTNNVFNFESDIEEDEDVMECRKIFRGIAREFGLPSEYVRRLLHRNSGYVDRTVSWIRFGVYSPWPPAWTTADDEALTEDDDIDWLIVKYGEADVRDRMEFLGLS